MTRTRVACFSVSLDGFGAGPNQSLENPLGERGPEMAAWFFPTRTLQRTSLHQDRGTEGVDNAFAERSFENIGAWILGRNMFGPIRGEWPDESWKGWWGDVPPYRCDVFVLTHHARKSFSLADTTFHFVTEGIHAAHERAKASANGKDIRIGGGGATIQQYLQAGLIDELHLALSPVLLGRGEPLFHGLDLPALGFKTATPTHGEGATHYVMTKDS